MCSSLGQGAGPYTNDTSGHSQATSAAAAGWIVCREAGTDINQITQQLRPAYSAGVLEAQADQFTSDVVLVGGFRVKGAQAELS